MTAPVGPVARTGRSVPTSMVVVGAFLLAGFVAVSVAMAFTVADGNGVPLPDASDLPLPASVAIIDSHVACRAEACDGHGVVVDCDPMIATVAVDLLAAQFEATGWLDDRACPPDTRCFARGDLRASMRPWVDVDPNVAGVMRASIRDRDLDESGFVYVKVTRCGILEEC